jgi:pyridinium-3,5-bisthiocarboxylic acid mononucleotide nickel chelatase
VICWINPATGLAGDMLLAALIDAGAPLGDIRGAVAATGLDGWQLTAERVTDHGLAATRVRVRVTDTVTERRAAEVIELASRSAPAPVAGLAVAVLTAIAEAEAALHGCEAASVHLHELGGHDTLIDIVGTAAALHALDVTDLVSAPLPLGTGQVATRHGLLPCPAPATLALLAGAAVTGTDLAGETVTPTAAALLAGLGTRYGPPPPMTLHRTGYGAGARRLADRPNVACVTLGSPLTQGSAEETVIVLETNLDDVTGETLAHVIARALAEGARDAWAIPAAMKKGRPGYVLHALAAPADVPRLQQLLFAETGSLGIRRTVASRAVLPRWSRTVVVDGVPVRIKHGPYRAKPEHDDVAAAAAQLGMPLRAVAERALQALGEESSDDR